MAVLFLGVDDDAARSNLLVHSIIIDHGFSLAIFIPDLDPEGVRAVISSAVPSPNHELVRLIIGSILTIDCTCTLELGIVAAGYDQPLVAAAVEVQISSIEDEFGVAGRDICAFLVFGDETEGGFACCG